MNSHESRLAHAIKIQFGTGPGEPTRLQLQLIVSELGRKVTWSSEPTQEDWRIAVYTWCPTAGTCKYGGIDNSHLNVLLVQAIQNAQKG